MIVPFEIIDVVISVTPIIELKPWVLVSKYCQKRVLAELKRRFPLQSPEKMMKICFFSINQDYHYLNRECLNLYSYVIEIPSKFHINIWSKQHSCFIFMAKFKYPIHILRCEAGYVAILTLSDQFMFGTIYVVRVSSAEIITHLVSPELTAELIMLSTQGEYAGFLSPTGDFLYHFGDKYIGTSCTQTRLLLPINKIDDDFDAIVKDNFCWENDTTFAIHANEFDDSIARTFQVDNNTLVTRKKLW